jgi:hypothetical protein
MTTLTRPKKRPTYTQALEIVRRLPPAEQRRLRDELVKLASVKPAEATVEAGLRPEVLANLERSLQENADAWDELSKL